MPAFNFYLLFFTFSGVSDFAKWQIPHYIIPSSFAYTIIYCNTGLYFMKRIMLSGKIHTATITRCIVDYEGSLEIDPELLAEANILPYEKILVANRNNGSRLETYAIPGVPGSKDFCLNGPAAKLGSVGDIVTIMAFSLCDEDEARELKPHVIVLGKDNEIIMRRRGRDTI